MTYKSKTELMVMLEESMFRSEILALLALFPSCTIATVDSYFRLFITIIL